MNGDWERTRKSDLRGICPQKKLTGRKSVVRQHRRFLVKTTPVLKIPPYIAYQIERIFKKKSDALPSPPSPQTDYYKFNLKYILIEIHISFL